MKIRIGCALLRYVFIPVIIKTSLIWLVSE